MRQFQEHYQGEDRWGEEHHELHFRLERIPVTIHNEYKIYVPDSYLVICYNPTFDSQTKETPNIEALTILVLLVNYQINILIKLKTEIVQSIIKQAEARENAKLSRSHSR